MDTMMYLLVTCQDFRDTIMRDTIAELIDAGGNLLRAGMSVKICWR